VQRSGRVATEVRIDPSRLRPSDEPLLVGDNTKLRQATGWAPQIDVPMMVEELMAYWRERIALGG